MASAAYTKFCETVKEKTDIVELVKEAGGDPRPAGRYQMSCCSPLRSEKNPSFRIYLAQNKWWDFGAQVGGDAIDFVKMWKGVEFNDAIDILADRVGMKWGDGKLGAKLDEKTQKEITRYVERRWVEKLSTDAATYYHSRLTPKVRSWLKNFYGFDDDIIDRQHIGWADGTLLDHMHRVCGHDVKDLLKTGLFIRTQSGKLIEHHELRVTFPYWRRSAAPYMISRRIDGVTPDTLYQKSKYKKTLTRSDSHPYVSRHVRNDVLYGEDSVRGHKPKALITEGVTDAITAIMCGWPVWSPVTNRFKAEDTERVNKYAKYVDTIVIINDNEEPRPHNRTGKAIQPGFDGAQEMAKALFEAGHDIRIGILPRPETETKVDLNSYVRDHGKKALDAVIENALPYPEFLLWRIPKDTKPAELDGALSPVYEAIAHVEGALEREAYVNSICKRFGLSKDTVQDAVDEFLRHRKTLPSPPALPAGTSQGKSDNGGEGGDPPSSGSSSDSPSSGPPSMPPTAGRIHGAVYESEDRYYYKIDRDKDTGDFVPVRLSNFVLSPNKFIQMAQGRQYCCDIITASGKRFRNVVLPPKVFRSARDFRGAMGDLGTLTWCGTDNNVQGVVEIIGNVEVPTHQGVGMIGFVNAKEGPRLVLPDRVIGPDGTCANTDLMFAPVDMEPPTIASRLKMDGADMPEETISKLAKRVIPKICLLNEPEVIAPMIGWFWASCVAPQIRAILRHFPICGIHGTQGSGKTTLARDIFWPCVGVVGEPFSCGDTRFATLKNMSSTSNVPLLYDEYRGLSPREKDVFDLRLRENYVGHEATRGRADQKLNRYRLIAPIVVIGEAQPDDPAIFERLVSVSPRKNALNPQTARRMRELLDEPLYQLGGHLHRWCLSQDIPELLARAQAQLHAKLLPLLSEPLAPRVRDNMMVVVLGNMLFDLWCEHLDVDLTNRPDVAKCFRKMVAAITDSEFGGGVKDIFDRFLESCSTYAHLSEIQEGVHYAMVDGLLCLHLSSCYSSYLQQRRRSGEDDETHGLPSLRRVMSEKMAEGSYIVDTSKRVRLGGRQVRCVAIDPKLIPEHLEVDEFPLTTNRVKGHQIPLETDWN